MNVKSVSFFSFSNLERNAFQIGKAKLYSVNKILLNFTHNINF